jgi:hypothetical protein
MPKPITPNSEVNFMLNKVSGIIGKYADQSKREGDNFNIFEVINLTSNEVRIHSRFLAELLNPNGSHGQDDLFLKQFVEINEITDFDSLNAQIYVEKYIGSKTMTTGGRIDIYIEDQKGNSIIIENKIYAEDQENQLVRYHNYKPKNIFYLTLFGISPSMSSYGNLQQDKDFKLISYRDDIAFWLNECKNLIKDKPLIHEGINHYLNLILHLTGQSNNKRMNNEIRDVITKNTDSLKTAARIEENYLNAKIQIQWLFWKSLKKEFVTHKIPFNDHEVQWKNVNSYYTKSRNRDNFYGLWREIFSHGNFSVHFRFELGNEMYSGFTLIKSGKPGNSNHTDFELIRNHLKESDGRYNSNKWWLGWKNTEPRLEFRNFNSETIFKLADELYLEKIVNDMVKNAKTEIADFLNFISTQKDNLFPVQPEHP